MTLSNIKIIVGLGNPGYEYVDNRHNIGYKVIDKLIEKYHTWPSIDFFDKKFEGIVRVGFNQLVILVKPTTGMNNSGQCVEKVLKELYIKPNNLLVIQDDISLPLGTIRLRGGCSAGGHNGIKSIIKELETENFYRLKIGIDKPNKDLLEYVLSDFTEPPEQIEEIIKYSTFIIDNILNNLITNTNTFKLNYK